MRILRWKLRAVTTLAIILGILVLIYIKIIKPLMTLTDSANRDTSDPVKYRRDMNDDITTASLNGHKLAVIVPFRDRFEELMEFVPHLHQFLTNASIAHRILIINQADKLRFNRAALINIGYKLSVLDCNYIVMHDVDLLPLNPKLDYGYPGVGRVFHVASPELHPLYHYPTFVGGILILTHTDFQLLNGLSNRYWGWGREDDEFYVRMKEHKLFPRYPDRPDLKIVTTGNKTFRHIHDRVKRPRDNKRYKDQKVAGSYRDRQTGLRTVDFVITETYPITIKKAPAIVYNIELGCDRQDTPWCEHPTQKP